MGSNIYLILLKKVGLKRLGSSFISNFGLLWLLTEPGALFFPEKLNFGWSGYLWLTILALGIAFAQRFPRKTVCRALSSPDSEIEIKIGNLFDQPGHLVIGFNDVFDTELGEIIKPSSIQGQFLQKVYGSDRSRIDEDIAYALQTYSHPYTTETNKKLGKTLRYPIGTAITLGSHDKRYFLTAYGYMTNDIIVQSNADFVWQSLSKLWQEVRLKGHGINVSMPIVGADLARTGLPRMALAKLIITSFIVASKEKFITRKLTVMIYPRDIESIDLYELEEFLASACF
jgi:Domain of unknown function (DUF6430)